MIESDRTKKSFKALCIATTLIEGGAGLALVCFPAKAVYVLFGSSVSMVSTMETIEGITGFALMALGCASWFARHHPEAVAARGIVGGMLIYNLGTFVMLGLAGIRSAEVGAFLWPAVFLHFVMLIWCGIALRANTRKENVV